MKTIIWIIILFLLWKYLFRSPGGRDTGSGTAQPQIPNEPVHFTMGQEGKNYYSYTPTVYRIAETIAIRAPFREMEVLIIVQKLDETFCSMSFQLEMDSGAFPAGVSFGSEFNQQGDAGAGAAVSYETRRATGFSTPDLVRKMIANDMASSVNGLAVTHTESSILASGAYERAPMVICRYSVKYTPIS